MGVVIQDGIARVLAHVSIGRSSGEGIIVSPTLGQHPKETKICAVAGGVAGKLTKFVGYVDEGLGGG